MAEFAKMAARISQAARVTCEEQKTSLTFRNLARRSVRSACIDAQWETPHPWGPRVRLPPRNHHGRLN